MSIRNTLSTSSTATLTELRRNPNLLIQLSDNQPTIILRRNKPVAYLLSTKAYEALLELIDDASLIRTAIARKGGKTIKMKI